MVAPRESMGELGPYTLLEQIAVGGMAEIYLAKTRGVAGFEKFLCLKVIHPNYADDEHFIEMLIDEAKIAVGLNHTNIVQIFDLGRDGKTYFIAMEYIDGADLFKVMRRLSERDIDVPIDVAAYIAHEVCTGLDYAHRKRDDEGRPLGIIHRDISPQNILISYSGEVKIVDFGIAKAASRSRRTQAGVIKGKYYYMSPEQAWGDPVDQRSDIFSAGIILYEVLTGQMLYLEEDMHRLLDMVRKADIPRPASRRPDIPPQLENVVMKALAKRPADRWQTAHEYQVALTNFLFSYAPDFTPARLADLLTLAMSEEIRPVEPAPRGSTRQVHVESLMSRVDYQPRTEHSVIFRASDLFVQDGMVLASSEEEDRGERTQISGPPSMMELNPEIMPTAADGPPEWARDNDPTTVSRAPQSAQEPTVLRPRRRTRSAPVEIVIPRAQITTDPDLAPDPTMDADLTPTPQMDLPPSPPRPQRPAAPPPVPPRAIRPGPPAPASPAAGPPAGRPGWPPAAPAPPPPVPPQAAPATSWPEPSQRPLPPAQPPPLGQGQPWPPQAQGQPWPPQGQGQPWPPQGQGQPYPPQVQDQPYPPQVQGQPYPAQPGVPQAAPAWPQGQGQPDPRWPAWPPTSPPPVPPTDSAPSWPNWPPSAPAIPDGRVAVPAVDPFAATEDVVRDHATREARRRRRRFALTALISLVGLVIVAAVFFILVLPVSEEGGMVEVISVPEGATVTFDGRKLEKRTPVVIPVTELKRPYTVEVSLANYQPWRRGLTLSEEDPRIRVLAVLTPIYGRLDLQSIPRGADIYINGEHRGKTPATIENLLPTEDLSVELRKRGYKPATRIVKWEGRNYVNEEISLVPSR